MIDTRTKIVPYDQLDPALPQVAAYCDPLLPEHIDALRALNQDIAILLVTPEDAYLEPRARAELAASLSFVKAVALVDTAQHALLDQEAQRRAAFLAFVRDRARD
jgi:hypothetical protein